MGNTETGMGSTGYYFNKTMTCSSEISCEAGKLMDLDLSTPTLLQLTLIISTLIILNNRLSQRENLVLV